MKKNLEAAIATIVSKEGGYSNHAWDNGGATNYGITLKTLSAWRKHDVTPDDVKALTLAEAREIYRVWYWEPIQGDILPAGLDLCVFNFAVNAGVDRAARLLQEVLKVPVDGKIGSVTLGTAAHSDVEDLISRYHARLVKYYQGLDDYAIAGKGWMARLFSITLKSAKLIGG